MRADRSQIFVIFSTVFMLLVTEGVEARLRNSTVSGPRGKTTDVNHNGNTSYDKGNGVTHTSDTTTTTPNGQTQTVNTQSNTTKSDNVVTTTRQIGH
jgi:hypothetical protein